MNDAIINIINWMQSIDVTTVGQYFGIFALLIWLAVMWWVWLDASSRYRSVYVQLLITLLVVIFPVIGLFVYLLLRPSQTDEEKQWAMLEKKYLLMEVNTAHYCPTCDTLWPSSYVVCPMCGFKLQVKCKKCGKLIPYNHKYCIYCGSAHPTASVSKNSKNGKKDRSRTKSRKLGLIKNIRKGYEVLVNSTKVVVNKLRKKNGK